MKLTYAVMIAMLITLSGHAFSQSNKLLENAMKNTTADAVQNADGSVTFTNIRVHRGNKAYPIKAWSSQKACSRLGYKHSITSTPTQAEYLSVTLKDDGSFDSEIMARATEQLVCRNKEIRPVVTADKVSDNHDGTVTFNNVRYDYLGKKYPIYQHDGQEVCALLNYKYFLSIRPTSAQVAPYGYISAGGAITISAFKDQIIEEVTCANEQLARNDTDTCHEGNSAINDILDIINNTRTVRSSKA
jgi:hypothetical protein